MQQVIIQEPIYIAEKWKPWVKAGVERWQEKVRQENETRLFDPPRDPGDQARARGLCVRLWGKHHVLRGGRWEAGPSLWGIELGRPHS